VSTFIRTARDAEELLLPLFEAADGDIAAALHLDGGQRLIGVGEHRLDGDALPVRALLSEALRLGGVGLVLGLRRGEGGSDPSEADQAAARELADTARSLGIRLFDLLVFAEGEGRSFRDLGLL
jgi:DNA repair protein RadC